MHAYVKLKWWALMWMESRTNRECIKQIENLAEYYLELSLKESCKCVANSG